MALKPCHECKQEVSTGARTCPHCGVKFPTGRPLVDMDAGENLKGCGCILMILIAVGLMYSC